VWYTAVLRILHRFDQLAFHFALAFMSQRTQRLAIELFLLDLNSQMPEKNPTSAGTQSAGALSSLWYLRRIKLLGGMSQPAVDRFNALTQITKRRRGEWIFMTGDPSQSIYFLQEGRIKISALSEDGHEVLLEIVGPGEIFGAVSPIQGTPRTTSAQVLDDALLRSIHRKDFELLLTSYPELSLCLLKTFGSKLRKAETQLLSLICKDVSTRVREALAELVDFESGDEPDRPVRIGITQQDLANLIGASRQKTWQALKELEDSGALSLRYGSILVTAPQKLRSEHPS
jgi:CRP/FNR family transcriptional regulator, cyclic AMP receptor protein